jgi:hypothetical protein
MLDIADDLMTVQAAAASPRLAVSVDGRVELRGTNFADLTFTVSDTSLDPYVRAFFEASGDSGAGPQLSPFTRAVVGGTVRVRGELARREALAIDTTIDRLDLTLFDYDLGIRAPFRIVLDRNSVSIPVMTLAGADTELEIGGALSLDSEQILMTARGSANLAILQGVVDNVRSTGRAVLEANLTGNLRDPDVNGTLTIENGRIRHFGAPHGIDQIRGTVAFDSRGVTLDGLTAQIGEGPVQFGGRIRLIMSRHLTASSL